MIKKQPVADTKARKGISRPRKRSQAISLTTTVHMDNKQRVSLTRMLSEEERCTFSTFRMHREGGRIVLEPVCQVPEKDHWMYKDPKALASLLKGIKDVEEGRLHDLGSFAKYAKDDDEG